MTLIKQRLSLDLDSHVWAEALSRALETRGFASLSAYVDSRPGASLAELASDLGGPDTTPIALEQRLIAEAEATGTMERCARGILAREGGGRSVKLIDLVGRVFGPAGRRCQEVGLVGALGRAAALADVDLGRGRCGPAADALGVSWSAHSAAAALAGVDLVGALDAVRGRLPALRSSIESFRSGPRRPATRASLVQLGAITSAS